MLAAADEADTAADSDSEDDSAGASDLLIPPPPAAPASAVAAVALIARWLRLAVGTQRIPCSIVSAYGVKAGSGLAACTRQGEMEGRGRP